MTPIGTGRTGAGRPTVSLEDGATPGGARCPACGEPLFVWVETSGFGPREDRIIDRCENCGLVVGRDSVPDAETAMHGLMGLNGATMREVRIRVPNGASTQAWLGDENWAPMRPAAGDLALSPKAAELLLRKRGMRVRKVRFLAGAGMASMWQTLLNVLTFHHDFATEALAGRLKPGSGKSLAVWLTDAVVSVLAAIPTAILAVLIEGFAVAFKRGGVIEVTAAPDREIAARAVSA